MRRFATPVLGASNALESFGANIALSARNADGTYTAARAGGAIVWGNGVTSSAAIVGDYVAEIRFVRTASNDIFVGVGTSKGGFAFTEADLTYSIQINPGYGLGAEGWFASSAQGQKSVPLNLYIERVGTVVNFYTAETYARARQLGAPIMSATDTGSPDAWFVALLRDPGDGCDVRFLSRPT